MQKIVENKKSFNSVCLCDSGSHQPVEPYIEPYLFVCLYIVVLTVSSWNCFFFAALMLFKCCFKVSFTHTICNLTYLDFVLPSFFVLLKNSSAQIISAHFLSTEWHHYVLYQSKHNLNTPLRTLSWLYIYQLVCWNFSFFHYDKIFPNLSETFQFFSETWNDFQKKSINWKAAYSH